MSRIVVPRRGLILPSRFRQRGFIINPFAFGGGGGDPYWSNVVSLLHFNGTNGSTTYTDEKGLTWTSNGANIALSTTSPKFGSASLAITGTNSYAETPSTTAFEFGTGDFTIEGWLNPNAYSNNPNIISNRNSSNGITLRISSAGKLQFFPGTGSFIITGTTTVSTGAWTHFALTRQGTTNRIFLGGNLEASGSNSTNYTIAAGMASTTRIGYSTNSGSFAERWDGKLDEMRTTKGVCRYTASFTPPTAAFPNS